MGGELKSKVVERGGKTYQVAGDLMKITEVKSVRRVIPYQEIRDAVKVDSDYCFDGAPWENCDGYDHTTNESRGDFSEEQRQAANVYWSNGARTYVRVTLTDNVITIIENDVNRKSNGMSKQVRQEMIAQEIAERYEQLGKWYRDGWEWYCITCKMPKYTDEWQSYGGYDSYEYASGEASDEVAREMAAELKTLGYEVTGIPELPAYDPKRAKAENMRRALAYNMGIDCWKAIKHWNRGNQKTRIGR